MSPLFGKKVENQGPTDDDIREMKLDNIKAICEKFVYDLGLVIAGHTVRLEEYVNPTAATKLINSVEPFLASGDAMKPNFGEYGELRVEGNILDNTQPIFAYIHFDDLSIRETASGELVPTPRRKMLLTLVLDPSCKFVQDFTLAPNPES